MAVEDDQVSAAEAWSSHQHNISRAVSSFSSGETGTMYELGPAGPVSLRKGPQNNSRN